MNLRRDGARPLVIGHRGAAGVAPENTLASLEAAVRAGADIVEFDVSPGLVLAHSPGETPADAITLDRALAYLAGAGVGVHVDVKLGGYERDVVAALRAHGLEDRALVSTALPQVGRALAAVAPALPRAIGYPRDRLGVSRFRWPPAATTAGAAALRTVVPVRVPLLLRQARANVLALHHTLCSRASIAAAHRSGAAVLAWPVSDAATALRLANLGVDAIVSDDPETTLGALESQYRRVH
ncbi:MAG TPA: glycerophosphodiester phosphodiesterase [Gaiellaceae bacterium]|nr:glycerophosphodiester phosphodiesterase [Gaiellaceae bacterium]